jgi:hypothetical protein
MRWSLDLKGCERMMSRPKLKCHVDWKYVTGSFHDQFELLCGLDQMMEDDVMTKYKVICG